MRSIAMISRHEAGGSHPRRIQIVCYFQAQPVANKKQGQEARQHSLTFSLLLEHEQPVVATGGRRERNNTLVGE